MPTHYEHQLEKLETALQRHKEDLFVWRDREEIAAILDTLDEAIALVEAAQR